MGFRRSRVNSRAKARSTGRFKPGDLAVDRGQLSLTLDHFGILLGGESAEIFDLPFNLGPARQQNAVSAARRKSTGGRGGPDQLLLFGDLPPLLFNLPFEYELLVAERIDRVGDGEPLCAYC